MFRQRRKIKVSLVKSPVWDRFSLDLIVFVSRPGSKVQAQEALGVTKSGWLGFVYLENARPPPSEEN